MDELPVIVEGIGNKVKRLVIRNQQLIEKLSKAEEENQDLREQIQTQSDTISRLESQMSEVFLGGLLHKGNSLLARQKVNDLLREIEKCQTLLNR